MSIEQSAAGSTSSSSSIPMVKSGQKLDRDENDPLFQFQFSDIPRKVREAEQYTDIDDFDASVGILKKCMELYDEKFGSDWIDRYEQGNGGEAISIQDVLFYARLLKEFGINCLYHERLNEDLGVEVDPESGKPPSGDADSSSADASAAPAADDDGNDADDDDDDDDDDSEDLSGADDTYLAQATANLSLSYHLYAQYINSRSSNTLDDQVTVPRPMKDEHGKDIEKMYIIGNKSSYPKSGTDMLDELNEGKLDITRVEICQTYLCDVYETLAEIHCEEEQWSDAGFYLKLALLLRQKIEKVDGRGLASVHSKYASYFFHQNQYEGSNYHYIRAASVFINRIMSRLRQLYDSVPQIIRDDIGELIQIPLSTNTSDDGLLIQREHGDQVIDYYTRLHKAIINMYGGAIKDEDIADDQIRRHVRTISDYVDIHRVLMERYDDNLQDIAEQKAYEDTIDKQDGSESNDSKSVNGAGSSSSSSVDETQRVKAMVHEVMRTDQIIKTQDYSEALGFGASKTPATAETNDVEVNVLTVKRKAPPRPAPTPAVATVEPEAATTAATAPSEQHEEQHDETDPPLKGEIVEKRQRTSA